MDMTVNSPHRVAHSRFSKALPSPPSELKDSLQTFMAKTLPSLPESTESKGSKPMTIPRRAVGSTSTVSKKNSIDSISSLNYSDSVLSQSLSESSSFTKESLSYTGSESRKTPPIPEKDEQRQTSPKTPNKNPRGRRSISSLRSSPGQEIWRRRSLVVQKGIEFPDLKLQRSNGSTASPPSKSINPALDRSLPEVPSHPLRSRGLSERGRGPVPSREAPQAPIAPPMGIKISKLKDISKRKATDQSDESSRHSDHNPDQSSCLEENNISNRPYQPHGHLPAAEQLPWDISQSQPSAQRTFSPTAPHEPSSPPQIPPRSSDRGIFIPVAGGLSTSQTPRLVPNLLDSNHSRDPSETLTITSLPGVVRSPQPQKPHATKTILTPHPSPPVESTSFSPSITSTTRTSTTHPHSRQTSQTTTSRATSLSYSYFPLSPSSLPAPGTVMPAPPITSQHTDCFQGHRFMRRSRNDLCPLQCQTCSKADFEQQWKCTWCCLRVCNDCMAILASVRKDFRTFLGLIGRDVPNDQLGDRAIVVGKEKILVKEVET